MPPDRPRQTDCGVDGTYAQRSAVASQSSPAAAQRCAKGAGLDGGDRSRSTITCAVRRATCVQLHRRRGSDRHFHYVTNLHQLDGRDPKVTEQGGDYVLALKGNQGSLHDDVRTFLDDPARASEACHTTVDGEHGRIETRTSQVSADIAWLQDQHAWPGLAAIGKMIRTRETGAKSTTETSYYLLSTRLSAERFAQVARAHWGVENGLHWVLDVTMNEDQARHCKDHGPENIALLRRLALNLAKLEGSKGSMKGKLKRAGWDNAFLTSLLAQFAKGHMR